VANGGTAGSVYTGVSIAGVVVAGQTHIVLAVGHQNGAIQGVSLFCETVNTSGMASNTTSTMFIGTRQWWPATSTGRITPSLQTQHNGDNHTATTPHLWLCLGRVEVRKVKLAWTGSKWSGPTSATIVASLTGAADYLNGRWDGSRFLMAYMSPDLTVIQTAERDQADSTYVIRNAPAHPQGNVRHLSVACNVTTTDFRVFAVGTTNDRIYYVDYSRGGASWGSWTELDTTATLGPGDFGVRGTTYGNSRYDLYRCVSGSPNTVEHKQQTVSYVPSAPTWVNQTGQGADVAAALLLDWTFSDPDPTDTQSAYAVSRQIGAGALAYWRASDSTWQATEQKNTSGTTSLTLSSSWGSGGDANHVYKAKVWDSTDTASGYSVALDVAPSTKVNPTVTGPAEGSTVVTEQVEVTWTVAEQTAFRVLLTLSGDTVHDSGWVSSSTASYLMPYHLIQASTYVVSVQTRNLEGLASTADTNTFGVSLVPPANPTLTLTPTPASGYIRVVVAHPTAAVITFVAVGAAATADNGPVTLGMPAGWAPGDTLFIAASIRNSGTGTVDTPTDWVKLAESGNLALLAKQAAAGDTAPSVTFTGGVAGADCVAQMAAFRGAADVLSAVASQLNGSAQDVAFPALTVPVDNQLILVVGWKQDDWTSVATLAGLAELGEPSSVLGDDAGLVWDYEIQTAKANISASSFTVTGGAAGISRAIVSAVQVRPAVASVELWRLPVAAPTEAIRIATALTPAPTYDDWRAVSGIDYAYRAVAIGTNATASVGQQDLTGGEGFQG